MDEQKRIFSINLNNLLHRHGKTQRQFSDDLGFKWTTVNTWCKGGSFPTSGKLQKIADYFHVGKGDLIDGIIDFAEIEDDKMKELFNRLKKLNELGIEKISERAEELLEVPKYRKE